MTAETARRVLGIFMARFPLSCAIRLTLQLRLSLGLRLRVGPSENWEWCG